MTKNNDFIYFANAFALIAIITITTIFALSIIGCGSKEVEYRDKVIEKYVPVPMKCDLNITRPPLILYDTLQNRAKSITELVFDGVELREIIQKVPCLKINYVGDFL